MRWSLVLFVLYSVSAILAAPMQRHTPGNAPPAPVQRRLRSSTNSHHNGGGGTAASSSHAPPQHSTSGNTASTRRPPPITIPSHSRSATSSPLTPLSSSFGSSAHPPGHGRATPSAALTAKLETWQRGQHDKVKRATQSSRTYTKRAKHSPWVVDHPHAAVGAHDWDIKRQTRDGTRAHVRGVHQADHVFEHQMLHAGLELARATHGNEGNNLLFKDMSPAQQTKIRQILNHKNNMQFVEGKINNRKGLRVKMAMDHTMSEAERTENHLHDKWKPVQGSTGYMRKTAGIAAHTAKELDDYLVEQKLIKEPVMHALLETTYRRAGIIGHNEGIAPLVPPDHSSPGTPTAPHTPPPAQQQHQDAAGNPIQQPTAGPSTGMAKRERSPGTTPPKKKRGRKHSPSPGT